MWLTRLALRNPVLILMMSLMTHRRWAWSSVRHLSVDLFPDITVPLIRVATFYTGAGPADIEKSITSPIERAVSAIARRRPRRERLQAGRLAGQRLVPATAPTSTTPSSRCSQRVAQILNTLPPGIQQPFIIKFDITNIPVRAGGGRVRRARREAALRPRLQRHRAAARAHSRRRQRHASAAARCARSRSWCSATRCAPAASASSTWSTPCAPRNLLLPSGNLRAGDRDYNVFANTQFPQARPLERRRRPPGACRVAGAGRPAGAHRRRRQGRATAPPTRPRSSASTASAASTCACSSSRARTPSPVVDAVKRGAAEAARRARRT